MGRERLPDFLIIGAMKSGTTTLYRDLYEHPRIFLPEHKEPNALCDDAVLAPAGRARYAAFFTRAKEDQLCGEASTGYTKWPDVKGVPQRGLDILGPDLKLIYITRDPVQRILSQYTHEFIIEQVAEPIGAAVRARSRYIDYSRYAAQLSPWLACFKRENVLLIRMEDYMADRGAGAAAVFAFLGLEPLRLEIDAARRFNAADERVAAGRFWRTVLSANSPYRRYIQPLIPWQLRQRAIRLLMPPARRPDTALDPATLAWLCEALADDTRQFAELWRSGVRTYPPR